MTRPDTSADAVERMCRAAPSADDEAGIPEMVAMLRALLQERDEAANAARVCRAMIQARGTNRDYQQARAEEAEAQLATARECALREAAALCRESYALNALQLEACILSLIPAKGPTMPNDTAPAWPDMLTCPHCGGDELAHGFQYPPPQGTAQCYSCGAAVIADTEEEAIATWNRRTPSEQSAREAAAVAVGAREMRAACARMLKSEGQPGYATCAEFLELPDTTALDRLLADAREEGFKLASDVALAALSPSDGAMYSADFKAQLASHHTMERVKARLEEAADGYGFCARSTPA